MEYDFIEYDGTGELRDNNRDFLTRLFPNPPRNIAGNQYYPFRIYGRGALHIPSLMGNPLIITANDGNTINPDLFFDLTIPTDAPRTETLRQNVIDDLLTWLNSEGTGGLHPNGFTREELETILHRYRRQDGTPMYNAIIQVLDLFDDYDYGDGQFAGFAGEGGERQRQEEKQHQHHQNKPQNQHQRQHQRQHQCQHRLEYLEKYRQEGEG